MFCFVRRDYDNEAKSFLKKSSIRCYKLYELLSKEIFLLTECENFRLMYTRLQSVKTVGNEIVLISEKASKFKLNRIRDENIKIAIQKLKYVGSFHVLGDEYFTKVLPNRNAVFETAKNRNIKLYQSENDFFISFYPDMHKIILTSKDAEEIKHYWIAWREFNLIWASVGLFELLESIKKTAKLLHTSVLEFWYQSYHNVDIFKEIESVMKEIQNPYKELHAFIRNELLQKYGADIVDPNGPIPVHLFYQTTLQAWEEGCVIEKYFPHKELPPYNKLVKGYSALDLIYLAEEFYKSLGFDPLENDFYDYRLKKLDDSKHRRSCKSELIDKTPTTFMNYCNNVDFKNLMEAHVNMSCIYYAIEKRELPFYFFNSYNLQYAVGEAVVLSACTPKHLNTVSLMKEFEFTDKIFLNRLFRMGINTLLTLPTIYVNIRLLHDLLDDKITRDEINKHFWMLMDKYAGVMPPVNREEGALDFAYPFYLDLEHNAQTRKFVCDVLSYQFYNAFYEKSKEKDRLQNYDFFGNFSVGKDLRAMMALGSSKPWHEVIGIILPKNPKLSGVSLLDYYAPMLKWINKKNNETNVKTGWTSSKMKVL